MRTGWRPRCAKRCASDDPMRAPTVSATASGFDHPDIWQVAELFGVVETIADHEVVLDGEPDVLDLDVDLAPGRLAQEAGGPQRLRAARAKRILKVHERQPGVDDVLDN